MEGGRREEEDDLSAEIEISRKFMERLSIQQDLSDRGVKQGEFDGDLGHCYRDDDEEEEEEEEDEEEEFSFMCGGSETQVIAAEDAFLDGKIKPILPYSERDSLFSARDPEVSIANLLITPPVKKVFVEIGDEETTSSGNDQVYGPCCEWSSRKAVDVEASRQDCKKSNSTGFSKIRRIRDLVGRSNSDGRDAFVFLSKRPEKTGKDVGKAGTSKESKKTSSAHEVYLRSKAREEEPRRSYLPCRPEFMGIFTNIHGGLSRNVHPF